MAKAAMAAIEALKANRGEDFFLYAPLPNEHMFGRDELAPDLPVTKELVLHSAVEVAETNYHSHYKKLDNSTAILTATRHFGSKRYQDNRAKAGLACCVAGLAQLKDLRARAWNEDTLDEALEAGNKLFVDSLEERGGELRRLILAELNESLAIGEAEYSFKGSTVLKMLASCRSKLPTRVNDITDYTTIPGEYEVAIWYEGGKYYMFDPYPATNTGKRVGLREGGKSYVISFGDVARMCEHFIDNLPSKQRRKPFCISEVKVQNKKGLPEPVCNFKAVAPKRWIVSGRFHEGDARFAEEHRDKQATPAAIAAVAIAHVRDPDEWNQHDVDNAVVNGDLLYGQSMSAMASSGQPAARSDVGGARDDYDDDDEGGPAPAPAVGMAAGDVANKFKVSDSDCIETEVLDCAYNGKLNATPDSGLLSLTDALAQMFREHTHAVVTARGGSVAVWKHNEHLYYFDPKGCDENGYRSDSARAAACLVRIDGKPADLAEVILSNLAPGGDDSFNISPVSVSATKLSEEAGVPEINLQSDAFEWVKPGTAALLIGARGEHSAGGKVANKAGVEDMSGRTLALPAAAAFVAAAVAVPPPQMHQDHMHQFLDAGADYYLEHVKRTGRQEVEVKDLDQRFELGANTFSIVVGDPITVPLKLPDPPVQGEGAEEEEEKELGEGEEEVEDEEDKIKDIKSAMMATMTQPDSLALLIGDYHVLGVWCSKGGQVVAYDPAPTLKGGLLTVQRIRKGDETRLQRLADLAAMAEDDDDEDANEEEEEEEEAEGEEKATEPAPDVVPPEAGPALHVYASPREFVDRLVAQGGLTTAQRIAPYKLYPVRATNELTEAVKEKRPGAKPKGEGDGDNDDDEDKPEEQTVAKLDSAALGKYYTRVSSGQGVLRGRIAQFEYYYMEPNRDNQDAAMSVLGIAVDHIESHQYWKPALIDALLKYGDRLYTVSLPRARHRPHIAPDDVVDKFHVINYDVTLIITPDVVTGDIKAGDHGEPLNLKRALIKFFESNTHGVICAKDYCVGVWRAIDGKALCMWEPHAVSASGRCTPTGAAAVVVFATAEQLASVYLENVTGLSRPGLNRLSITSVKVSWDFGELPEPPRPDGVQPDEGYDNKVLTAYVEIGKGRTILRGSRPHEPMEFREQTRKESSCGAVVGACMAFVRRPELWTKRTVDEVMKAASPLHETSVCSLGYELRPGEDFLMPLQVVQRFVLGINYVRFRLETMYSGKLENSDPNEMSFRCAVGQFLSQGTHCVVWSVPHAVGVWRERGSALCYLWEPHACGPSGMRSNAEDGAACVLTFTSPQLLAHAYLENVPAAERASRDFQLCRIDVTVQPIKPLGGLEPPLVKPPPVRAAGSASREALLPATSKVDLHGRKRRADETRRKPDPGSTPCVEPPLSKKLLMDKKSMSEKAQLFSLEYAMGASKGRQGLSCCVMAAAMSRVEEVCKWTSTTVRHVLESGDQLYKDSYLHFRPQGTSFLTLEQILRKLYTPGNCVCRVVVYRARHSGNPADEGAVYNQLNEFFREECTGIMVCGEYCCSVYRTSNGYYLFEPADRDRWGRVIACRGRARAVLSHFLKVQELADHVAMTIPRPEAAPADQEEGGEAKTEGSASEFMLHGVNVTNLRRLNREER